MGTGGDRLAPPLGEKEKKGTQSFCARSEPILQREKGVPTWSEKGGKKDEVFHTPAPGRAVAWHRKN